MKTSPPKFNSKVLLFGEYTLMSGSMALTLPFTRFSGQLEIAGSKTPEKAESNRNLEKYLQYLQANTTHYPDGLELDLDEFKRDIEKGLCLNSDIPQGYGVGSSGVIVASIYSVYSLPALNQRKETDLSELKKYFSFMESYFHGKSSGLDPLSCYSGKPLLLSTAGKPETIEIPLEEFEHSLNIFLIDTGTTSQTDGLVNLFTEMTKQTSFQNVLMDEIIPRNNNCINSLLEGEIQTFSREVKNLSTLQLKYFSGMIPGNFLKHWKNGIESGDYSLKLCGSGGGGFILGFTPDYQRCRKYFNEKNIRIFPFQNDQNS